MNDFFYYLRDAIAYRTHCPVCHSEMKINERDASIHKSYNGVSVSRTITWFMENSELSIDLDTNEIKVISKMVTMTPVYGIGYHSHMSYTPCQQTFDGKMFTKLDIDCEYCSQYSFTIQLLLDVGQRLIEFIRLNSETLSIEDVKGDVHEIRNVYVTGKTEYSRTTKTIHSTTPKLEVSTTYEGRVIVLPLIKMDLQNPQKMLEKIKTYILFS